MTMKISASTMGTTMTQMGTSARCVGVIRSWEMMDTVACMVQFGEGREVMHEVGCKFGTPE